MKHILFVDDESRILDGLRRMLRSLRNEWDMQFAGSGAEALELLGQQPFDIVVSDMRMPGMSGAELLAMVKTRHPDVVRIVLSGHADSSAVMAAFGVAQQYLMKPCDQVIMQHTVNRALALKERLGSPQVRQVVGSLTGLPTLPSVYQELVAYLKSPNAALPQVARIIAKDVGMTAAMLKVVNSAYFNLPKPIATIERAVSFLGLDAIMALTLDHGLFGQGHALPEVAGFDPEQLRRHSLKSAALARALAESTDATRNLADEAFLAGVLHDVGKLVLAMSVPTRYCETRTMAAAEALPYYAAEQKLLQTHHGEVGAYLLGLWGFPDSLVEATLFHDVPLDAPTRTWALPAIVHLASAMASAPEVKDPADPALQLQPGFREHYNLDEHWPAWHAACRDALAESVTP